MNLEADGGMSPIKLVWDSALPPTMVHMSRTGQFGAALNPLRYIDMDSPWRWPKWAIPRHRHGMIHRCGGQVYYETYWWLQCVRCHDRSRPARREAWRQHRARYRPRPHETLWQNMVRLAGLRPTGRLAARSPAPRRRFEVIEHHCSEGSPCRTIAGRKRIVAWAATRGRRMVLYRCWQCGCFFPLWPRADDRAPDRLCDRCNLNGRDDQAKWLLTTLVRQMQALWSEALGKST